MRRVDTIYSAIGRFVVAWSDLEYCLDLLVLSARDRSSQPEIPHQLDDKLKFLKDSVKRRPELAPFAEAINKLSADIRAVKDGRHDYVHGTIIDMTEEARPMVVTLHRLLQPSKKLRRPPLKITGHQINSAADDAHRLADRALDMAEAVRKPPQLN